MTLKDIKWNRCQNIWYSFERNNLDRKGYRESVRFAAKRIAMSMYACVHYRNTGASDADVCYRINRWRVDPRVCTCPRDINRPTQTRRDDATWKFARLTSLSSSFSFDIIFIPFSSRFRRRIKTTWYSWSAVIMQIQYLWVYMTGKNISLYLRLFSGVAFATFVLYLMKDMKDMKLNNKFTLI